MQVDVGKGKLDGAVVVTGALVLLLRVVDLGGVAVVVVVVVGFGFVVVFPFGGDVVGA